MPLISSEALPVFDNGGATTIAVTDTPTLNTASGAAMVFYIFPDLSSTVTVNVRPGSDTTTTGGFVLDADRPILGPLPCGKHVLVADAAVTINRASYQ